MYMKKYLFVALAGIVLAMSVRAQERPSESLFGTGEYQGAENVRATQSFATIGDAMKALPAMPTAKQISNNQAKYEVDSLVYAPFNLAIEQSVAAHQYDYLALSQRIDAARLKQAQRGQTAMQQYNKNVEAGLVPSQQEMMQIIMQSGINIETATEEQIMQLMAGTMAKKWGVSPEEYMKIVSMAQRNPKQTEAYLKSNHPDLYNRLYAANADGTTQNEVVDPRDDRFGQIAEELRDVQEQISAVLANRYNHSLETMRDNLREQWLNSDEAKQIDAIEKALWERVEQWEAGLSVGANGFADVDFPAWWTAERKKENALIDQWNNRESARWLSEFNGEYEQLKAAFDKAARLEAENEQLGQQGDTENLIYLTNKQQLLTLHQQLLHLVAPYRSALLFPCIEHQEETGSVHLGKG